MCKDSKKDNKKTKNTHTHLENCIIGTDTGGWMSTGANNN